MDPGRPHAASQTARSFAHQFGPYPAGHPKGQDRRGLGIGHAAEYPQAQRYERHVSDQQQA